MVRLYRFDRVKGKWVLVDYGVRSKVHIYIKLGYLVVYR